MKVWIDLANSPHPLLFAPIARRFERQGWEVEVTVRDHAQTLELARERWPAAELIGGASPGGRTAKARAIVERLAALRRWARQRRPDVALSHNSYAQILAARSLRIPAVTAMDYEHQPANHLAFRSAARILLPEAVPAATVARQGASESKVIRYPGLKEQLYLGDFEPNPMLLRELGLDDGEKRGPLVVARSAPANAAYHRGDNPLFISALEAVARQPGVQLVVLARHPAQRQAIEELHLPHCILPKSAIDGRSLLINADLFLGAGGTMTRESALLGIPTFTLFAGKPAAVDQWLEQQGALVRLAHEGGIGHVMRRQGSAADLARVRSAGRRIEDIFYEATIDAMRRAGR